MSTFEFTPITTQELDRKRSKERNKKMDNRRTDPVQNTKIQVQERIIQNKKSSFIILKEDTDEDEEDDTIIINDEETWQSESPFDTGMTEDSPYVEQTTLFKSLPYLGNKDKDELEETRRHLEFLYADHPPHKVDKDEVALLELIGTDSMYGYLETGPVLQVVSISIFNDDTNWIESEIYGNISISDYSSKKRFFFYDTNVDDSNTVSPDYTYLPLTPVPLAPVIVGNLEFNLFNDCGIQIFSSASEVDYSVESNFEGKEELLFVYGKDGYYAKMVYTIIPCALVSQVYLSFFGPSDAEANSVSVDGKITLNDINFLTDNEFGISAHLDYGNLYHVPKSRYVVAVPTFSSLLVEFSVTMDGNDFSNGQLECVPCRKKTESLDFKLDDQYYFSLSVDWQSPAEFFRLLPEIQPMMSDQYVEVFSVVLAGGSITNLCGDIVVRDRNNTVYTFSRKKFRPDKLGSKRRVSLTWPSDRWVQQKDFYMHLKLRDEKENLVCRGSVSLSGDCYLDRRVCAVIEGEDDYFAAVHYSIFRHGLRAQVTIIVDCGNRFDYLDVSGSVSGRYDNYDYSSTYDMQYYSIVIFDRCHEYRVRVENGSQIPLQKSLVTAPFECSELSIDVGLKVRPFKDKKFCFDLYAGGRLRFKTGRNMCRHIPMFRFGGDCFGQPPCGAVEVKVDWFDGSPLTGN